MLQVRLLLLPLYSHGALQLLPASTLAAAAAAGASLGQAAAAAAAAEDVLRCCNCKCGCSMLLLGAARMTLMQQLATLSVAWLPRATLCTACITPP
jgi:hypothetical protein